ncbi:uncharacterized protein K460DRAFT_436171 [Cucurbitaria berberidis CBS 394.84]|uniref:Uncharacterized protein n=1 Tax=Cucurbitaria berberidis CBS 394.84 TaxID=1168544 RepID=A0A9P4L4A0_9PLEO|nr:uncharacterized protein K460DRAFT_436171 [Cucurbitaria berberidis CBS 394.84]KAF1840668.1 hypothetical protein K460DRAFT_436171 [Cucurbitaria berberidis CBS 394.84]
MSPRAKLTILTTNKATAKPPQPYTAAFLARLSTFILHAPLDIVSSIFTLSSKCDGEPLRIDPNCMALQPDTLTSATCQRLLRMLNLPVAHASPSTIPLALHLLFRFRLASHGEDASDASSDGMGDGVLVAVSIYIAYKWLMDGGEENTKRWTEALGMNNEYFVYTEIQLLGRIEYRVWVQDEEYVGFKGKAEELWEGVFKKAARPTVPPSLRTKARLLAAAAEAAAVAAAAKLRALPL